MIGHGPCGADPKASALAAGLEMATQCGDAAVELTKPRAQSFYLQRCGFSSPRIQDVYAQFVAAGGDPDAKRRMTGVSCGIGKTLLYDPTYEARLTGGNLALD